MASPASESVISPPRGPEAADITIPLGSKSKLPPVIQAVGTELDLIYGKAILAADERLPN